jgi:hypothetical protein
MQNGAKRRHKDVVLAASSALALALSVEMSVADRAKTPIRYIVVIYGRTSRSIIIWHLPQRGQPARRDTFSRAAGHADGQRAYWLFDNAQSQQHASVPA